MNRELPNFTKPTQENSTHLPEGLALLSQEQIIDNLISTCEKLENTSPSNFLKQQRDYYEALLYRLGIDVKKNKQEDPVYTTTGHSLGDWYDLNLKIANADKDLAMPLVLHQVVVVPYLKDGDSRIKDNTVSLTKTETHINDYTLRTSNLFKSATNPNLNFGFGIMYRSDNLDKNTKSSFYMPVFSIESDVCKILSQSPRGGKIIHSLEQLAQFGNHDATAHLSFLPFDKSAHGETPLNSLLKKSEIGKKISEDFCKNLETESGLQNSSGELFSGELLSLEWQKRIIKNLLERSPRAQKALGIQLQATLKEIAFLESELNTTNPTANSSEIANYLREACAFFFFRIIDQKDFTNNPEWKKLAELYPTFKLSDKQELYVHEFSAREFEKIDLNIAYNELEKLLDN